MGPVHRPSPSFRMKKSPLTEAKKQVLRGILTIDRVVRSQGQGGQKRRRVGCKKTLTFRTRSGAIVEIVYRVDRHQHRLRVCRAGVDMLDACQSPSFVGFDCQIRGSPYDNASRPPVPELTWKGLFDDYTSILGSGESMTLDGGTPGIERLQSSRTQSCEPRPLSRLLDKFDDEHGGPPIGGTEEDEYAPDVAKYMLELETKYLVNLTSSTDASRQKAIELIELACQSFGCLLDTLWLAIHIFDRFCLSKPEPVTRWQLLSTVCFRLAFKITETSCFTVSEVCEILADPPDFTPEEVSRGERVVLQKLNYDVFIGYSPWFWIDGDEGGSRMTGYVQDFLVRIAIGDERLASIQPSLLAAAVLHATERMEMASRGGEKNNQKLKVLRERYEEKEVVWAYRMLMKRLEMDEEGRLHGWYASENRCGASAFAIRWAKGLGEMDTA